MKTLRIAMVALAALCGMSARAHALAFAPEAPSLPFELSSTLPRTSAAASHTGSAHRVRPHHRRHRHAAHHRLHSVDHLQATHGSLPSHPGAPHRGERRAALPQVARHHRPSPQGRHGNRAFSSAPGAPIAVLNATSGLEALEHDSFGNFAGDRGAGRGPPRASPLDDLPRVFCPAAAFAGGASLLRFAPASDLRHSEFPTRTVPRAFSAWAAGRPCLAHPEGTPGLEPASRDRAARVAPLQSAYLTGSPSSVSPAVRVEGSTAGSHPPSVGGLT
jgi:hypothetical protein